LGSAKEFKAPEEAPQPVKRKPKAAFRLSSKPDDTFEVQTPQQIIEDATEYVHGQKPLRPKLDESLLENPRGRRTRDMGHVALPDIRVRNYDDLLSRRVVCELLRVPVMHEPRERPKEERPKASPKGQNPWFVHPHRWYAAKDRTFADAQQRMDHWNFPYADEVDSAHNADVVLSPTAVDPTVLSQMNRLQQDNVNIVDAYRHHMRNQRIPHFLT